MPTGERSSQRGPGPVGSIPSARRHLAWSTPATRHVSRHRPTAARPQPSAPTGRSGQGVPTGIAERTVRAVRRPPLRSASSRPRTGLPRRSARRRSRPRTRCRARHGPVYRRGVARRDTAGVRGAAGDGVGDPGPPVDGQDRGAGADELCRGPGPAHRGRLHPRARLPQRPSHTRRLRPGSRYLSSWAGRGKTEGTGGSSNCRAPYRPRRGRRVRFRTTGRCTGMQPVERENSRCPAGPSSTY